jgi:hypothetical protein
MYNTFTFHPENSPAALIQVLPEETSSAAPVFSLW